MTDQGSWETVPCVEWAGARQNQGYGWHPSGQLAHRVAFERHNGHMPVEPMVVDHLCRNRLCVEPLHLQEVTRAENTRLGVTRKGVPTTCKRCGDNNWGTRKNGSRRCKTCHVRAETERNRSKRAAA